MKHALLTALRTEPWAMLPEHLDAMRAHVLVWDGKLPEAAKPMDFAVANGVAVIPIHGVMRQKGDLFTLIFGGASTEIIAADVLRAASDPAVRQIVLDINSPGGSVFGVQELSAAIKAADQRKPVFAVANSMAASAAYWTASQARKLYVTTGGQVGSIGVYQMHADWSKRNEMDGIDITYISAGKYKTEGNPDAPLTDEAKADMQTTVNAYYDAFVSAVASGRGVTPKAVRDGMGQGRMVMASDAKSQGMADGVRTLADLLTGLWTTNAARATAANAVMESEIGY